MNNVAPLQSDNTMDFDRFTNVLKYLLEAAWGDWGSFMESFPNGRDPDNVEMPAITYTLKRMLPGKVGNGNTREIKPRERYSHVRDVNGQNPEGTIILGRSYDCEILFEVWHENNAKVTKLSNDFMELIDLYTGYFKKEGLKNIMFQEYSNEMESVPWRDNLSCRSIYYTLTIEKLTEKNFDLIKSIETKVKVILDQASFE